jgi:hypothetical protein
MYVWVWNIICKSNLCTVFNSLQNPHPDECILATVLDVPGSTCGRIPFDQFVNNDTRLPGLLHWSHSAVIGYDPLRIRTDGSPWGLGPDCRLDEETFPAVRLNPFYGRAYSVGSCVVLQDDLFRSQTLLSRNGLRRFKSGFFLMGGVVWCHYMLWRFVSGWK